MSESVQKRKFELVVEALDKMSGPFARMGKSVEAFANGVKGRLDRLSRASGLNRLAGAVGEVGFRFGNAFTAGQNALAGLTSMVGRLSLAFGAAGGGALALVKATANAGDAAARLLVDEVNPLTAVSGLEDWERVLGLPDACLPSGDTLQERRGAVLAKLRDEGRQDLAWWYEVAASLGYDVAIEEHWPFLCGVHECFDPSNLTEREIQAHHEIGFLGSRMCACGGMWWSTASVFCCSAAGNPCARSGCWTGARPRTWSASCGATGSRIPF